MCPAIGSQCSAVQDSTVQYSCHYKHQVSLGINGAPFSPDYAILRWTDTSTTALKAVKVGEVSRSPGRQH